MSIIRHNGYFAFFIIGAIAALLMLLLPVDAFSTELSRLFNQYKWFDKVGHVGLFFILALTIFKAFLLRRRTLIVIITLLALGTEIAQSNMGGARTGSIGDVAADLGGLLFALAWLGYWVKNKLNGQSR
jgi:VanZ family protein